MDWRRLPFALEARRDLSLDVDMISIFDQCVASNFDNVCIFKQFMPEAQDRAVEEYVQEHQDRSRNALQKSVEAAFHSWAEDLKADQAQFMAEKLLPLGIGVETDGVAEGRHGDLKGPYQARRRT